MKHDVVAEYRDAKTGRWTKDIFRVEALTGDEAANKARSKAEGAGHKEVMIKEITPANELTNAESDIQHVLPNEQKIQHEVPAETYGVGPTATGPALPSDPRVTAIDPDNSKALKQTREFSDAERPQQALKDAAQEMGRDAAKAALANRRKEGDEVAAQRSEDAKKRD